MLIVTFGASCTNLYADESYCVQAVGDSIYPPVLPSPLLLPQPANKTNTKS